MSSRTFRAMGTEFLVMAPPGRLESAEQAVREWEGTYSRFLPTSTLSLVNADESETVELDEEFASVLAFAAWAKQETGGRVDVGLGSDLAAWGYDRSLAEVGGGVTVMDPPAAGGWSVRGTTLTRSPGVAIDLGGILKGWVADRLVESGEAQLVSAGGDLRSSLEAVDVEVMAPDGGHVATIRLDGGGLATSTTAKRRWDTDRGPAHHLLDPVTGAPAVTPVVQATATAATAAAAEVAAKAILLHGVDGLLWAERTDWVGSAVVVWEDGSVYASGVEVVS